MRALQTGLVVALVVGGIAAATTTTLTTGCGTASQVRQIFMALDGNGDRPRNTFYPDTKQIFCDVVFSGYTTDETLDVQWIQDKGETVMYDGTGNLQSVSRLWAASEAVPTKGISTVGFPLDPPHQIDGGAQLPFPVGHWRCVVTINGVSAGESDFDIVYPTPDCPAGGGAYNGLSCVGNKGDDHCPVDSNYQPNGTDCRCQNSSEADPQGRTWVCQ